MSIAVLSVSLVLQIAAALVSLQLIRVTGRGTAWMCLSGAMALMAVRRSITLYLAWTGVKAPELQAELVALAISILMLVGVSLIAPLVRMVSQADEVARLNREVKRSEAMFRGVFEQTFQFVGLMTTDGVLIEANRSSLDAAGVDLEDVLNKPFWETVWWSHSPALQERLREAVDRAAAGQFDRFDAVHPGPDGSLISVDFSLKPLYNADGEIIYLIPEGRDVTEREKREAQLQRLNERLQSMNKELDEFAYIASHDLKSPLRAIENLSGWIVQDAADVLPKESAEHLAQIRERIRRMDALLDDLLAYSRAGRVHGASGEVNVKSLVDEIVELISMPEDFTVEASDDLPTLETLKTPLATCLRNLIDNAVKHHDRSDGKVRVSWSDHGEFVDLIVEDDGPGIDPRFHERVFKIFQSLQPRGELASTGVGLANVRKTANSYGGEVWVDSTEGHGARFTLRWPRKIDLAALEAQDGFA